jgi:hemoglobin-like flavoprotein
MTPTQISLVRSSFALVEPIQEQAAVLFYRRLFELDPTIARLFAATDMARQRQILMQTLAVVVRGLDRLDVVGPAVEALGRRHVRYGVRAEHYATVGSALVWTLGQGLGAAFTADVRDAWVAAFGRLAGTMQRAAIDVATPVNVAEADGAQRDEVAPSLAA